MRCPSWWKFERTSSSVTAGGTWSVTLTCASAGSKASSTCTVTRLPLPLARSWSWPAGRVNFTALRTRLDSAEYNSFTVVIILNLRNRIVGIVVDSVSDVLELPAESIKSAPDIESIIDAGCILGLGSVGDRMLILLDIERLMSGVDMGLVAN